MWCPVRSAVSVHIRCCAVKGCLYHIYEFVDAPRRLLSVVNIKQWKVIARIQRCIVVLWNIVVDNLHLLFRYVMFSCSRIQVFGICEFSSTNCIVKQCHFSKSWKVGSMSVFCA